MADIYSKSKRSQIMAGISGKETKPEVLVRKFLFKQGLRYRKNVVNLPGKPDIVLPKYKAVIFIHGCFWHGHSCKKAKLPASNSEFWKKKIQANIDRDKQTILKLNELKWRVFIVWQCEISNLVNLEITLSKLIMTIKN